VYHSCLSIFLCMLHVPNIIYLCTYLYALTYMHLHTCTYLYALTYMHLSTYMHSLEGALLNDYLGKSKNPQQLVQELHRVIKPGAPLILIQKLSRSGSGSGEGTGAGGGSMTKVDKYRKKKRIKMICMHSLSSLL